MKIIGRKGKKGVKIAPRELKADTINTGIAESKTYVAELKLLLGQEIIFIYPDKRTTSQQRVVQ